MHSRKRFYMQLGLKVLQTEEMMLIMLFMFQFYVNEKALKTRKLLIMLIMVNFPVDKSA